MKLYIRNKINTIRDYSGDPAGEGPEGSRLEVIAKLPIQKRKRNGDFKRNDKNNVDGKSLTLTQTLTHGERV